MIYSHYKHDITINQWENQQGGRSRGVSGVLMETPFEILCRVVNLNTQIEKREKKLS